MRVAQLRRLRQNAVFVDGENASAWSSFQIGPLCNRETKNFGFIHGFAVCHSGRKSYNVTTRLSMSGKMSFAWMCASETSMVWGCMKYYYVRLHVLIISCTFYVHRELWLSSFLAAVLMAEHWFASNFPRSITFLRPQQSIALQRECPETEKNS